MRRARSRPKRPRNPAPGADEDRAAQAVPGDGPHRADAADPRILWGIVGGVMLGALVGGLFPRAGLAAEILGQIFLNLLMALVVPLVILSIVHGITSLGRVDQLGSLGWRTLLYYAMTTALAVAVGMLVVNAVAPGVGVEPPTETPTAAATADGTGAQAQRDAGVGEVLSRLLVGDPDGNRQGLIPRNLFRAMARADILPLILFAVLFGIALVLAKPAATATIQVIEELNGAVMTLVNWVMWLAPVGIFGLLAARIGEAGGFAGFVPELRALGWYSVTVLLGLAIHATIVLPLILWALGRRQPFAYARGLGGAILTAFSTASSSATLPLTLRGTTRDNDVREGTASFVLPLGATMNMDGTALYESVAAIFIAQVYAVPLDAGTQLVIFLTATLAAIGAAGIPEAGLVTMVIVLTAAGLPVEGIGLILAVDWILDRFRTSINVWGDSVGAAVVDRYAGREPS